MNSAGSGTLSDTVVLVHLKEQLDKASATQLEAEMAINPNLQYYKYWDSLKARYTRDVRALHRQNWRMVKLRKASNKVTLQEWAEFTATYLAKRNLVEDWTDAEDEEFVFSQVPEEKQKKVMEETNRKRRGQNWVRIMIPSGVTAVEFRTELETELGHLLNKVNADRRWLLVECANAQEKQELLELNEATIGGAVIRCNTAEYHMSGEEMLTFVRQLLEEEYELELRRKTCGYAADHEHETHEDDQRTIFAIAKPSAGTQMTRPENREPMGSQASSSTTQNNKKWEPRSASAQTRSSDTPGFRNNTQSPTARVGEPRGKQCWNCYNKYLPFDHDYDKCPKNLERWAKRAATPTPTPKGAAKSPPAPPQH